MFHAQMSVIQVALKSIMSSGMKESTMMNLNLVKTMRKMLTKKRKRRKERIIVS